MSLSISFSFSSRGNLLSSSSLGLSLGESSIFSSLSSLCSGSISSKGSLGISLDLSKLLLCLSLDFQGFSLESLLFSLCKSNLLSIDSLGSLSIVVVMLVHLFGVTEALLLNSWKEIVGIEVVGVAANATVRFVELEVSGLECLFEGSWLSVIRGHSGVDSNTIAGTVLTLSTAHVSLFWWFFFTEVLLIEGVNLHSPCVSKWFTSVLFIYVSRVGKESRSLLPSNCLCR
jgi:hypothetical protein